MDFPSRLNAYIARVEAGLDRHLPPAATRPERLHAAMRYSIQAGGKRLRPVLVLAAAEVFDPSGKKADPLPAAVALECLHTYSLIHDDLPCMDNDDLRRGRPTCHRAFDEATALLAGDALLTHAFALIPSAYVDRPELAVALSRELGSAAGSMHLVGGQMEDLLAEKKSASTADELEFIHLNKTAAMIQAALVGGGLIGGAGEDQRETLRSAGRHLGLAFQIVDDLLDATGDAATLGKTPGKDARAGKATYVRLHGREASRRMVTAESAAAIADFRSLPGDAAFLTTLTQEMTTRTR
ncbi:MAG: polyprenyl synthetase [Verrucomicrobia bacterium RIFCSPLOWO2_12_FULL_64_8]|nr:MAG: polyprenyl synthetase [Verrucomicrobia bacterium RIFCSPLOWO2_12_FULL_64_8]